MEDHAAACLHTHEAAGEFKIETTPFALDPTTGRGDAIPKHRAPWLPFAFSGSPFFGKFEIEALNSVVVFSNALPEPWQQWDVAWRATYFGDSFSKCEKLLSVADRM